MSRYHQLALALFLLDMGALGTAGAQFVSLSQPDTAYTSETHLLPITGLDYVTLASLSDGTFTVGFSDPVGVRTVPLTWQTWGTSPAVESSAPRVLRQPGSSLTLTFSAPLDVFGLEAEPASYGLSTFTAQFFDGTTNVGTISQSVNGDAGARLFAASDVTHPFTSVMLNTTDLRFAIAQIRYALAPGSIPPVILGLVPEPAGLALGAGVSLSCVGLLLRRRLRYGKQPGN